MDQPITCTVSSADKAEDIINRLRAKGFSNNDISVLFPDRQGTKKFSKERHTKAPEGAATGAGTGGVVGGALGWLVGIGSLAIPGLGPFIAAGPIMSALSGAAVGATIGGLIGTLVGMGIPEHEAKNYEGKLKKGNILISVHAKSTEERERAKAIFEESRASDVTPMGTEPYISSAEEDMKPKHQ